MRVNWGYHDLEITLLIIQDKLNTKFAKSETRVIENSDFCDIQRGDLMLTNDNNVRRNDLSLRLKYIGIKTRIFKIAPFKYVILSLHKVCYFADIIIGSGAGTLYRGTLSN